MTALKTLLALILFGPIYLFLIVAVASIETVKHWRSSRRTPAREKTGSPSSDEPRAAA